MGSSYLENLSSNGIINYDAETYINTGKQKFGSENQINTELEPSKMQTIDQETGAKLQKDPAIDAFIKREDKQGKTHTSYLGKILVTTLASILAVVGGIKIKSLIDAGEKPFTKGTSKLKGFFKTIKNKISSIFKRKTKEKAKENSEQIIQKASDTVKTAKKGIKEWFINLPKKVKIIGGSVLGLIGLYGIYSLIENRNKNNTQTH